MTDIVDSVPLVYPALTRGVIENNSHPQNLLEGSNPDFHVSPSSLLDNISAGVDYFCPDQIILFLFAFSFLFFVAGATGTASL